jgi:hypothetical protein
MNNKLTVVVALVAGLAGGLLTPYIAPPPVFAQALTIRPSIPAPAAGTPVTDELRARSFMLVDQFDHAVGSFTAEPTRGGADPSRITLRDANGKVIWIAGGSDIRPAVASSR